MGGHLVLVGYMGSGKSTLGPRVAEVLGMPFVELDSRIEEMAAMSIQEIFVSQGEARFREFESSVLRQTLAGPASVIATGGGVPMDDGNWRLVLDGNVVVHLSADTDELLDRIGVGGDRPLATGESPGEVRQQLVRILEGRRARYAEAPHTVDTSGRDVDSAASEVVAIGRRMGLGRPEGAGG
ncbi:MAG: shikimate kinase [Candidatus Dormiibacterota bacterium]